MLGAVTAMLIGLPIQISAQQGGGGGGGGRGNFDPEQMRQRMMDRYKEMLEVKTMTNGRRSSRAFKRLPELGAR